MSLIQTFESYMSLAVVAMKYYVLVTNLASLRSHAWAMMLLTILLVV